MKEHLWPGAGVWDAVYAAVDEGEAPRDENPRAGEKDLPGWCFALFFSLTAVICLFDKKIADVLRSFTFSLFSYAKPGVINARFRVKRHNYLQSVTERTAMIYYAAYENPDGTPLTVDKDFFGHPRKNGNPRGPFARPVSRRKYLCAAP